MARPSIVHASTPLCLVSLLVDDQAISCNYCADIMLFFFTTNAINFVVDLNRCKVFREDFCVPKPNLLCRL